MEGGQGGGEGAWRLLPPRCVQILIREGDVVEDSSLFHVILSGNLKVYVITPTASTGYGLEVATLSIGEVSAFVCADAGLVWEGYVECCCIVLHAWACGCRVSVCIVAEQTVGEGSLHVKNGSKRNATVLSSSETYTVSLTKVLLPC